jgi:hypothetical protein
MFGHDGFRHNSAHTSGLDQPENRRDEVDNENNQIAHEQMVHGSPKTTEFRPNVEFATDRSFTVPRGGEGPISEKQPTSSRFRNFSAEFLCLDPFRNHNFGYRALE